MVLNQIQSVNIIINLSLKKQRTLFQTAIKSQDGHLVGQMCRWNYNLSAEDLINIYNMDKQFFDEGIYTNHSNLVGLICCRLNDSTTCAPQYMLKIAIESGDSRLLGKYVFGPMNERSMESIQLEQSSFEWIVEHKLLEIANCLQCNTDKVTCSNEQQLILEELSKQYKENLSNLYKI